MVAVLNSGVSMPYVLKSEANVLNAGVLNTELMKAEVLKSGVLKTDVFN